MPNQHNQVTNKDFFAPKGAVRIIREDMHDGKLYIIVDIHDAHMIHNQKLVKLILGWSRRKFPGDIMSCYDDNAALCFE